MTATIQPGSIVSCRGREWVLMPSPEETIHLLRPLTGATDELVAVHKQLSTLLGYTYAYEHLNSATFPLPTVNDLADAAGAKLLWQSARLLLREGAVPFRSLGKISITPRNYQFVPLLMALRLDPVRLLIADDVGVGKTIEALLVTRELLDRGEIRRFCVLCPPYLCDQWQKEISEKFNLEAVIVRSGTVRQLERQKSHTVTSIYQYFPFTVVSIDYVKSERNKHLFLMDCPELVIVDEAHGVATTDRISSGQHQRHALVAKLSQETRRHLLYLTATPHSGIESAFQSLLGLVRPNFADWSLSQLSEPHRIELARHFVQRTRKDIEKDWEVDRCFPQREAADAPYPLSPAYTQLFRKTFRFCSELVASGEQLEQRKQRVRYWGALALLRCVMSSPAAAVTALEKRRSMLLETDGEEDSFSRSVFESSDDTTDDGPPLPAMEASEATLPESDKRKLRELAKLAQALHQHPDDTKLTACVQLVAKLLKDGFQPIVWCRYIATSGYVADGLRKALQSKFKDLTVLAISGLSDDEERKLKIEELAGKPKRVLVATDCLSEGVNLQQSFNAVIHYDLPWNPNRLEQREGRVDRYGQPSSKVKTIRFFSPDNPVDGAVIRVLLDKAREIHRTLGTHVPVPEESESVTEAVLKALFFQTQHQAEQQSLFASIEADIPEVQALHFNWDQHVQRERENRTRFAQRALKPQEVAEEVNATDKVLGDADAVKTFVLNACQRLRIHCKPDQRSATYKIACDELQRKTLPHALAAALPVIKSGWWTVSFSSPTPEKTTYLGRNHRFVAALAQYLLEEALTKGAAAQAARCGVVRTTTVKRLTVLYLLRVRFLLAQPDHPPLLAEEVQVIGHTNLPTSPDWLPDEHALTLLEHAQPDANVEQLEKQELVTKVLDGWSGLAPEINRRLELRANELLEAHRRIRKAVDAHVRGVTVTAQQPPDLLGLLILQPMAGGQ